MATVSLYPTRTGRLPELFLLGIALALGIGAYIATSLTRTGALPGSFWFHLIALVLVTLITHLGVRYFAPYADPVLLPTAMALNGIGLAMIYRLDQSYLKLERMRDVVGMKQLIMTAAGIAAAALVLMAIRDHRKLRRFTFTFGIAGIFFLLLPMLPFIGKEINGARIWIGISGIFSFQPAELAKISLAIFFAGYLVSRRDSLALGGPKILGLRLPRLRDLGPLAMVWATAMLVLVGQRDLGTSLLLFGLFVVMLYIATDRVSWLIIGAVMFTPSVVFVATTFSHVRARFVVWLYAFDPQLYAKAYGGSGQLVQGQFGLANGGLLGTGWGAGYPQIVPYANSDFIIASLGEELGLTGLVAILLAYLILVHRGLRTAIGVRDGFGKLLAAGLSFTLGLQIFVVIGGITRVIPLTGLTAPFLANGGSSLVSSWITLALLLRISDAARRPTPQTATAIPSATSVNPTPRTSANPVPNSEAHA